MTGAMPVVAGRAAIAAAFGLGVVAATGQAPLGMWWLTLPAFAALVVLVGRAAGPRRAAVLGLWAGAGHFGLALSWIVEPFLIDMATHGWMAPFALMLMAFGLALFWAVAAGLAACLPGLRARALGFAGALTLAEMARGVVFTGFPWAQPGHSLIGTTLAQVAAVAGPEALTLIVMLAAALPVAMRWPGLALSGAMLAGLWVWGADRLAEPMAANPDAPVIRLVQPNAEQSIKWDPDLVRGHFDRLLTLTRLPPAPGAPAPELAIWPETAVPYLMDRTPDALWDIAEAGGGMPVATGIQRSDGGWRYWNSLAVIGPGGAVQAVYDKHHLVPFGEYIPFGDLIADWFGITAFATQEGNGYSFGPGPALLDLGSRLGRALPLICYEAVFPRDIRAAPGRADWLMQVTNDAWFGRLNGPYQHLAQARLRAIEQGLPMLRVANTGVSAVIDARGRVAGLIPLGVAGHLDVVLPGALPATPYARHGDLLLWMMLAGLGFAAGLVAIRGWD
ncbi:MAG: apolipoprotein N-acyltransferase [Gemmobacter sp.]